jgi:transcriptional regulator with XRE-family HTH domain
MVTQAVGVVNNWRVRMHDLIARGVAAARRRKGWTQEQAAREFRAKGLPAWRTSAVSQLEAGLRRPRFDEVLLMCDALGVDLLGLVDAAIEDVGDESKKVGLGDGIEMSLRAVRALIRDFHEFDNLPDDDTYYPPPAEFAEMLAQSEAMHREIELQLNPIRTWWEDHGHQLLAGDWRHAFRRPTDAEKHAARRLGVYPAQLKLAARLLWNHRDFEEERDSRIGDIEEINPRSRQARRGLVTREMFAELKAFFDEALAEQAMSAGGETQ